MARSRPPEKIKKKVRKRDNYSCQNCGQKGGSRGDTELHVHHIVPLSDGGSNKKSNLKTLCKDCHEAIHHKGKNAPTVETSDDSHDYNGASPSAIFIVGGFVIFMWVDYFTSLSVGSGTIISFIISGVIAYMKASF